MSGASALWYFFWEEVKMAPGCGCHGTFFGLLGKVTRMKRSTDNAPSNKFAEELRTIPSKTRVFRTSMQRWSRMIL